MQILRRRERIDTAQPFLDYTYANDPNAGFAFECDEAGNVDETALHPSARASLAECRAGTNGTVFNGIGHWTNSYVQPAIGRCDCGAEVELGGFTNTCKCGADYNAAGQRLARRELWGDDTGESVEDILRIP